MFPRVRLSYPERSAATLLLEHWELLKAPLLHLSLFFKRHRAEYYRLLGEVGKSGDWEARTDFFLVGVRDFDGLLLLH